jgi:hypothetical protein
MASKTLRCRKGTLWKPAAWLAAAVASLLLVGAARAALQFDVFLGYDGIMPERGWFPIVCELDNDGPSFTGVVEVNSDQLGTGQTRRMVVDLPTNTRKRVVIPVFSTPHPWTVRLLDERGKIRAEQVAMQIRRTIERNMPLVAAVSRNVGGVPAFPEAKGKYQNYQLLSARLQPALFPDNPLALEGIDMLYLNSEKALELSLTQVNAIMAWLQHGGHLVVGVEQVTDISGNRWLKDLMPCDLTSTGNLDNHQQLQNWLREPGPGAFSASAASRSTRQNTMRGLAGGGAGPVELSEDLQFESTPMQVSTGSIRDGAVLIGAASTPLAIEARRGRGRLTVLAFSPEREPFLSWKSRDWFWAKLAGIPAGAFEASDVYANYGRLSSDGIFGSMIDSKQVRKLPVGWLLLLLLAYLAVIGPLDQYWLKRINRQMLTWVTFPCYVVLFSGLIYLIGFHLRAGELEWNELNVVDVLPDHDRAVLRGETYISIYSPVNAHYPLRGDQPFATLRGEYLGNFGGAQESSRAEIVQHGNSFEADAMVPVWTSQLYVADWLQPASVPMAMSVSRQGAGWQVTVENNTPGPLSQARVVLEGRVYELAELPAQQSKTFSLTREQGMVLTEFARQFSNPFRNAVQSRHNTFGNNAVNITDVVSGAMAASFLPLVNGDAQNWNNFAVSQELDLTRFSGPGHGILLAWDAGHSLTEAFNRFEAKRLHRDTLLRLVIDTRNEGM